MVTMLLMMIVIMMTKMILMIMLTMMMMSRCQTNADGAGGVMMVPSYHDDNIQIHDGQG